MSVEREDHAVDLFLLLLDLVLREEELFVHSNPRRDFADRRTRRHTKWLCKLSRKVAVSHTPMLELSTLFLLLLLLLLYLLLL